MLPFLILVFVDAHDAATPLPDTLARAAEEALGAQVAVSTRPLADDAPAAALVDAGRAGHAAIAAHLLWLDDQRRRERWNPSSCAVAARRREPQVAPVPAAAAIDAGAGVGTDGASPPSELARPPELPAASATSVATAMLAQPTPAETEPPRPITKRLWFWLAVTGVVAGAVLIGIAVSNPTHTRPDCPPDYVCPP